MRIYRSVFLSLCLSLRQDTTKIMAIRRSNHIWQIVSEVLQSRRTCFEESHLYNWGKTKGMWTDLINHSNCWGAFQFFCYVSLCCFWSKLIFIVLILNKIYLGICYMWYSRKDWHEKAMMMGLCCCCCCICCFWFCWFCFLLLFFVFVSISVVFVSFFVFVLFFVAAVVFVTFVFVFCFCFVVVIILMTMADDSYCL